MRIVVCALVLVTSWSCNWAQDRAGIYRLRLSVSGGYQRSYFREQRAPGVEGLQSNGSSFLARGLWHPNHLLSVGLVSGLVTLSRDEIIDENGNPVALALTGIPLHLAFAMQTRGLQIGAGVGGYQLVSSTTVGERDKSIGTQFELGVHAWLGYTLMLGERLGIGAEVSTHTLSYRGITSIAPHLRVEYVLVTY